MVDGSCTVIWLIPIDKNHQSGMGHVHGNVHVFWYVPGLQSFWTSFLLDQDIIIIIDWFGMEWDEYHISWIGNDPASVIDVFCYSRQDQDRDGKCWDFQCNLSNAESQSRLMVDLEIGRVLDGHVLCGCTLNRWSIHLHAHILLLEFPISMLPNSESDQNEK